MSNYSAIVLGVPEKQQPERRATISRIRET